MDLKKYANKVAVKAQMNTNLIQKDGGEERQRVLYICSIFTIKCVEHT